MSKHWTTTSEGSTKVPDVAALADRHSDLYAWANEQRPVSGHELLEEILTVAEDLGDFDGT